MRSQAIAGMPRQIVDRETGKVLATANFPSPQMDENGRPLTEDDLGFTVDFDDLWWRAEMAQCLLAESYFFQAKNRTRLLELRWLDPRTIDPQYEAAGVVGFMRTSGGRKRPLSVEDVVWFHRPGLKELGSGKAPGQVAARAAGIADYMDMFIETFFERGAMPTTVVFSETRPEANERGRLKAYLENILTGIGNAFGVEVLNSALRFETLTPPLKDMLLPDIKDGGTRDIAIAMGVPASLIFEGASNFATAQVDDLNFYTKTVVPEARFLERQVNKLFFKKMGMLFQFRPDQLEIYQQQEAKKVSQAVLLYDRDAIDKEELRAAGGYQPREQTAVPAPAPTSEADAAQPTTTPSVRSRRAVSDGQAAELKQWERKVMKRFPEEMPYTIPFEPAHLTTVQTAVVRKSLLTAKSKEEVKAAFAAPFRL
jgi:HK97 family phage portal protein